MYFDRNVKKPEDITNGDEYIGPEILLLNRRSGDIVGFGSDQGIISFPRELDPVVVTPANNYTDIDLGLGESRRIYKGTDWGDYGDFWGHMFYWSSKLFGNPQVSYDFHGNIRSYRNIVTGTAPDGSFKGVNPKELVNIGKTVKKAVQSMAAKTGTKALPSLDATGKVHGTLPRVQDLGKYSKEELQILLKELRQSVQKRIEVTSKMGRDRGHGQRQGAEQDLIKSLEKHLGQ